MAQLLFIDIVCGPKIPVKHIQKTLHLKWVTVKNRTLLFVSVNITVHKRSVIFNSPMTSRSKHYWLSKVTVSLYTWHACNIG